MQFVWCPPKGELQEDATALVRTAGNIRTVFGGNADSKLIAAGIADAITSPTLDITPPNQRGFCRGRQLSLNVVDIDAYMRAHNQLSGIEVNLESPREKRARAGQPNRRPSCTKRTSFKNRGVERDGQIEAPLVPNAHLSRIRASNGTE